MTGERSIRFYFSFRSPYAWLAAERLDAEFGDLDVSLEFVPLYPTPETFPNDPTQIPNKVAYLVHDTVRLAREQGLRVKFPAVADPDWSLSHAAFLAAQERAAGPRFMLETFRARWCEGLDLGLDPVIGDCAERAGLPRSELLEAAHCSERQRQVADNFRRGIEEDGIFGVPSFIVDGKLYWGQDRMRFVRRAVLRETVGQRPAS